MKISIIGGGIGGLAMAQALRHVGLSFDLYEQASELTDVGAGIGLTQAPISILKKFGLGQKLDEHGVFVNKVILPDKKLAIRRSMTLHSETLCIHRARLIETLATNLSLENIHLSKKLSKLEVREQATDLHFEDGTQVQSDCVIAADGINSVVRQHIFPNLQPRFINQTIWRGITELDLPEPFSKAFLEIWEEEKRYLIIPITEKKVLWLAVIKAEPGGKDNPETIQEELIQLFENFHPLCHELIRKTENVLRNDMADLGTKSRKWYSKKIVFIGDAIHATTPNMAQGGCQAIEDAYCLALCLKKYGSDLKSAYQMYYKLRHKKAMKIVSTSWLLGKAAHSRNPFFHYGMRLMLTHTPEMFLRKQENFLNDLSYVKYVE